MSSTTSTTLPPTHRALVLTAPGQPLSLQTVKTPEAIPGSVVIRILVSNVEASMRTIIDGRLPHLSLPTPYTPGARAIGRIAATGPDTTAFEIGQLVYFDPFVCARDNAEVQFLQGAGVFGDNAKARQLNSSVWRDGMFAEYGLAPLENVYALDEKRLLGSPEEGGLGYTIGDLSILTRHLVAYGGFRGIDLKAGETVIVAPATGGYSGAAVEVASAMGARVIAASRNVEKMQSLVANNARINVVQLEGDFGKDLANVQKFGPVDAFLDISPPAAEDSTHVRSCLMALKSYGRASLMGFISKDIPIPYALAAIKNLTIRCQYMYGRDDVYGVIKLVEAGLLKLGKDAGHSIIGEFKLEEWDAAMDLAEKASGAGVLVLFKP